MERLSSDKLVDQSLKEISLVVLPFNIEALKINWIFHQQPKHRWHAVSREMEESKLWHQLPFEVTSEIRKWLLSTSTHSVFSLT